MAPARCSCVRALGLADSSSLLSTIRVVLLGSLNREKESKMVVAKRQGREKPGKIEQKKVRGPE